jgi:hypothetical protein
MVDSAAFIAEIQGLSSQKARVSRLVDLAGREGWSVVIKLVPDSPEDVALAALNAPAYHRSRELELCLIRLLESRGSSIAVQGVAIQLVGNHEYQRAVEAVRPYLTAPAVQTRLVALVTLRRLKYFEEHVADAVRVALEATDEGAVLNACEALAEAGTRECVDALLAMLSDEFESRRVAAAKGLGQYYRQLKLLSWDRLGLEWLTFWLLWRRRRDSSKQAVLLAAADNFPVTRSAMSLSLGAPYLLAGACLLAVGTATHFIGTSGAWQNISRTADALGLITVVGGMVRWGLAKRR